MNDNSTPPQHKLRFSIFYHFLPGIVILLFYVITKPLIVSLGFQPSFGILAGFLFAGIPIQFIIMFKEGYKVNGRFSLSNIIYYKKPILIWQYVVLAIIFIIYAMFVSTILSRFNSILLEDLFSWLPDWFKNNSQPFLSTTPIIVVVVSFAVLFLVDGIINPIVEEVYFRGFLMPRISRFGVWTPIVSAVLFSLVHFWQPWNAVQIFLLVLPVYYVVWYKQNFYISVVVHCLANLLGATFALSQFLGG